MREVLNKLTGEQIQFICQECSTTKDELFNMDEDQLYERVYDKMCDIEIAETPSKHYQARLTSIQEGEVRYA